LDCAEEKKIATHRQAWAFKTKTGNHVARGNGWLYMVVNRQVNHKNNDLVFKNTKI